MPLGALPANNTDRLFVRMSGTAGQHDTVFRFADAVTQDNAIATARAVLTAWRPFVSSAISFISARWQVHGSHVSFPVVWGAPIVGTNATALTGDTKPQFTSVTGRSLDGRRCRITVFGWPGPTATDYRFTTGEIAELAPLLTALSAGPAEIASISGQPVLWNAYLNVGRNAYYQRKARRVG